MKDDAFDDVVCPFNYKAELRRVRRALNAKLGRYISENPTMSYRDMAKKFHLSVGTFSKIASRYEPKRKPGPRPRRPRPNDDSTALPLNANSSHDLP